MSDVSLIEVLLVEDNPADVRLTREAFRDGKIRNQLSVVSDGIQAMDFLKRQPPYEKAPRPDIILLDLNLPRMSGREVLERVKSDPDLRRIPVVILTTSEADKDVLESYDLHANSYIVKPIGFDNFLEVTREIEQFWLTVVKLPR